MGNIHAVLLSGEKLVANLHVLALLVTSGHESAARYQKGNLTQVSGAQNLSSFFLFCIDLYLRPYRVPLVWALGSPLAFPPSFSYSIVPSVCPVLLFPSVMLHKFLYKSQAHPLLGLFLGSRQVGLLF